MSLKPLIVEKGIIQPSFSKRKHSSLFRTDLIQGGVLTNTGLPVRQSKVIINEREIVCPARINTSKTEIKYVDDNAIYFSIPQNHFGHVLTGTMAFAYILLRRDYVNHKIVFIDGKPCEPILILLEHLGIDRKNVITINQYVQFKSVAVVKPSLRIVWLPRHASRWFKINKEIVDTFRAIAKTSYESPSANTISKVYFSRRKLTGKSIMCEDKIERVFEKNGYKIFYPEQLPLDEQIRLVANADFYACVQGTLEHHSLFMKDGATLIVLSRKDKELTERQVLINKLQKTIEHIYLRTNVRPFTKRGRGEPNIIGATEDLIEFFDKNKFVYDAKELKPTHNDLRDYLDKCFRDGNERCLKIIEKRLIKNHKDFWNKMR